MLKENLLGEHEVEPGGREAGNQGGGQGRYHLVQHLNARPAHILHTRLGAAAQQVVVHTELAG